MQSEIWFPALGGNWTYGYDANHELTSIGDPNGNTIISMTYSNSKVATQTIGAGNVTTFQYDTPASGDTTVTNAKGNATIYTNDDKYQLTNLKDPLGKSESYAYDDNGNRVQVTDRNGNVTKYTFDSMGNMTSKTDALGKTTTMVYDTMNDLLEKVDPMGHTTAFAYDALNRVIKASSPDSGATTYSFNPDGTLNTKTDANGGSRPPTATTPGEGW